MDQRRWGKRRAISLVLPGPGLGGIRESRETSKTAPSLRFAGSRPIPEMLRRLNAAGSGLRSELPIVRKSQAS